MSLLFDLEALTRDGGLTALQSGQRDFSPYVIHFTNYEAMRPVRECMSGVGKDTGRASRLVALLEGADRESAVAFGAILSAEAIEARKFHKDYAPAVCLTECTLAGVLTHSSRYGRYGLVFPKDVVFGLGGRPLAYVPEDVRRHYIELAASDELIKKNLLHMTSLSPPRGGTTTQDFTHEREWRCPTDLSVRDAVALIVATTADYRTHREVSLGLPVIPLELLYRMGV